MALADELCRPARGWAYKSILCRLYGALPAAQQTECRTALATLLADGAVTLRCATLQVLTGPLIFPAEQGPGTPNAAEGSQYRQGAG